jgi:ribosomal protein L32
MSTKSTITLKLIAPCGMNCGICLGYLREKNKCPGCRGIDENKPDGCRKCIIKSCQILKKNKMLFCSDKCKKFPCLRLKNLDKRYRTKYGMSMLENLENIKKFGIRKFVKSEQKIWKCPKCGELFCVHRDSCLKCGEKRDYKVKYKN